MSIYKAIQEHNRAKIQGYRDEGQCESFIVGALSVAYENALYDLIEAKKQLLEFKQEHNIPLGSNEW